MGSPVLLSNLSLLTLSSIQLFFCGLFTLSIEFSHYLLYVVYLNNFFLIWLHLVAFIFMLL